MICPFCKSYNTTVKDSRLDGGSRVRRYQCLDCGRRFSTRELWERDPIYIKRQEYKNRSVSK